MSATRSSSPLRYNEQGADELVFFDITASSEGRKSIIDVIERTADRCFMPLTVGGGVRSVADMRALLRAGADKISLNSAALARPEIIREGAAAFGNQCMVVSIDAKKTGSGRMVRLFPRRSGANRLGSAGLGAKGGASSARAKSCSTASIPTACRPATISRSPG